ncbi:MAG: XkdX family protein [Eubacterium sp.]
MARIWKRRIEDGTQKFEKCPTRYKNQVRELLKQDVKDGIIRAEDYKAITGEDYVEDTTATA